MLTNLLDDVYFSSKYIELYLNGDDELFDFSFNSGNEVFRYLGIKSKMKNIGSLDIRSRNLYDVSSAYGFGGFYTNSKRKEFVSGAITEYKKKCAEESIVASFSRFHPFSVAEIFEPHLNYFTQNNETVYVDTQLSKEERWANYSSRTRNKMRKCQNLLTYDFVSDITAFCELYNATMQRKNAEEFYFFDLEYFNALMRLEESVMIRIKCEDVVVTSGIFFVSSDIVYYHLGASATDYMNLNGTYLMMEAMADLAHSNGKKALFLGGGTTGEAGDSLLRFKKLFSKDMLPYFIGGMIMNSEEYVNLITIWESQHPGDSRNYFLKYRI